MNNKRTDTDTKYVVDNKRTNTDTKYVVDSVLAEHFLSGAVPPGSANAPPG